MEKLEKEVISTIGEKENLVSIPRTSIENEEQRKNLEDFQQSQEEATGTPRTKTFLFYLKLTSGI